VSDRHNTDGAVVLTGAAIDRFRLSTLRRGLKLEILGMHKRGRSCYTIVKDEFGFKGNRKKVLAQLVALIESIDESMELNSGETK